MSQKNVKAKISIKKIYNNIFLVSNISAAPQVTMKEEILRNTMTNTLTPICNHTQYTW